MLDTQAAADLIDIAHRLHERGWLPATSGNLSIRLAHHDRMAITVSGADKGNLNPASIMTVDFDGATDGTQIPSAETLLHCQLYRHFSECGVVLHTHSVYATVLSTRLPRIWTIADMEIIKAFPGVESHEATIKIPVIDNDQNIGRLVTRLSPLLDEDAPPVYLIRGHGLYAWGADLHAALRHVEAIEFLLQCEYLKMGSIQR